MTQERSRRIDTLLSAVLKCEGDASPNTIAQREVRAARTPPRRTQRKEAVCVPVINPRLGEHQRAHSRR